MELGDSSDMSEAAHHLLRDDGAEVIIVKCGAKGAWVYEKGNGPHFVPAFRSKRVFKIGTGDVFSAVFAYHWCERRQRGVDAAMAASSAVSLYAETRTLKMTTSKREPVRSTNVRVAVVSFGTTLPDLWLREEARSALIGLGAHPVELPSGPRVRDLDIDSVLVLADGNRRSSLRVVRQVTSGGVPAIVFSQKTPLRSKTADVFYADDFSTAIYNAFWVSSSRRRIVSTTTPNR
jgi:hypothetical protein